MKIALITDLHFGARNDNQTFAKFFSKFYTETFFPELEKRGIKHVFDLGDTFDRRKYISFTSLKSAKEMFFNPLAEGGYHLHCIVGNHDSVYKNTIETNSIDLLLADYDNITTLSTPQTYAIEDFNVFVVPWICAENQDETFTLADQSKAQVCFGHLELDGYEMNKGFFIREGWDDKWLKKFELVCSGHYHTKQQRGNVHYLGCPYEMTWNDYEDQKGFHIFDTETRELEFIPNPFVMFHKLWYDDEGWEFDDVAKEAQTFEQYKDCMIKVVIRNKTNPHLYDHYIERLEKAGVSHIQVADDHLHMDLEEEQEIFSEAEDTPTILSKYVDALEVNEEQKPKLKRLLDKLYSEALTIT